MDQTLLFASVTCLQGYIRWDPFVLGAQSLDMSPLSLCWHNKMLLPANCLKSPKSQLANSFNKRKLRFRNRTTYVLTIYPWQRYNGKSVAKKYSSQYNTHTHTQTHTHTPPPQYCKFNFKKDINHNKKSVRMKPLNDCLQTYSCDIRLMIPKWKWSFRTESPGPRGSKWTGFDHLYLCTN
jgi:hypothetical protein